MKKMTSVVMAGLLAASLLGGVAMADDDDSTLTSSAREVGGVEEGPFTSANPTMARVVTFPFRVATGSVGAAAGLVGGTFKGLVTGVQDGFQFAEDNVPNGDVSTDRVARGLLYFPAAGIGTALYVPKNIVEDAASGAWEYGGKACQWWDRL